jgi:hypothetical protein
MQAVLDRPLPPQEVGEPGGAGLGEGEAGDRVYDHGPPPSGAKLAGGAGDLEDLGGVRKAEVVDGDGLEGAQLDPAVGAVADAVQHGDVVPRQVGAAVQVTAHSCGDSGRQDSGSWRPTRGSAELNDLTAQLEQCQ